MGGSVFIKIAGKFIAWNL